MTDGETKKYPLPKFQYPQRAEPRPAPNAARHREGPGIAAGAAPRASKGRLSRHGAPLSVARIALGLSKVPQAAAPPRLDRRAAPGFPERPMVQARPAGACPAGSRQVYGIETLGSYLAGVRASERHARGGSVEGGLRDVSTSARAQSDILKEWIVRLQTEGPSAPSFATLKKAFRRLPARLRAYCAHRMWRCARQDRSALGRPRWRRYQRRGRGFSRRLERAR